MNAERVTIWKNIWYLFQEVGANSFEAERLLNRLGSSQKSVCDSL